VADWQPATDVVKTQSGGSLFASTTEVSICRSRMLQYLRSSRSISRAGPSRSSLEAEIYRPPAAALQVRIRIARSRAFKVLQQLLADAFATLRALHCRHGG